MNRHALLSSVIDQQVVKLRARDLPRHSALVMHRLEKIEWPGLFTRRVRKLHAVLPNEGTFLQLFEYTETTEGPIRISHQRFADVMARKDLLLKKNYLSSFACENAGNRAPCGSSTHYDYV